MPVLTMAGSAGAAPVIEGRDSAAEVERLEGFLLAQGRRTCKSVSTCREAVILWCQEGYRRADGDSDGIPCETVCGSRAQVEEIMAEVGC